MKIIVEIFVAIFMIVMGGKRESDLIHLLVEERIR